MSPLLQAEVVSQGLVFRSAPPLWVIILVIIPAIVAFAALFYRMGREGSPLIRGLLAGIRVLVLLFVALLLMDPAMETLVVEQKPTLTMVLADVSASMDHRDDYITNPVLATKLRAAAAIPEGTPLDGYSRLELTKRVLDDGEGSFLDELSKNHRVRVFSFGERLQGVPGLRDLEARDRVTGLGRALERVLEEPEVKSNPIGGIVVLSDGKNTAGIAPEQAIELAERRKIPVHSVAIGDPEALKDIELVSVLAPSVVLVDDLVTIELRVRHRGFPAQRVEVRLLENEQPLHRQSETLSQSEEEQEIRMLYRPLRQGTFQWVVEVRPLPGEHTTANNRRTIEIRVKSDRLKVLYVETYPRWEYRRIKDLLVRGEEAFQSQCFLFEADRGFPQESTPGMPSLDALPETEEEIFFYDVIVFGDVDPDKLGDEDPERSRRFMELVRKFVEEGGGFAMIAGDRFSPRAYKDTPIGEILPIIVDPTEGVGGRPDRGFKVKLTPPGREHSIMQLVEEPDRNLRAWEQRPGLIKEVYWFEPVKKEKPGALVLATHESERNIHGPYPIFVAGTYGEGPVFFSAIDETWRWFHWQGPYLHHRFWGNVIRHLARTRLYAGDKRFRLFSDRTEYQIGDRITLTAYVKDRTFRPSDSEEQSVMLAGPDRTERRESLRRVAPGKFQRSFVAAETGEYQAWIPPEDGITDERISPAFYRIVASDIERREPVLDEATLRMLADRTGGHFVTLEGARELISKVAEGTVEIPRQRRFLHLRNEDSGWLYWLPAVFLALLTTEWLLRKRYRLL